jgi:alpha-methylacyl-CoA racemase
MVMADFGANVVKIDRIGSASDMYCNRGKKSFACDLKQSKAKEAIEKLISTVGSLLSLSCLFVSFSQIDVLIDPFRPGVLEKLALGADHCMALNPRLVFVRVTGFGQTGILFFIISLNPSYSSGPYASMAGHDINYVAMSGVLSVSFRLIILTIL